WGDDGRQTLDDFAGRYGEHIRLEEDVVYPAAQALLAGEALTAMGEEMQARRMTGQGEAR
ncbi:hypothetical protein RZS08_27910, partial [Arthrospira platensis SPKY1]|nr:hypothetical protein [Arthrospira platensis SPKY1]